MMRGAGQPALSFFGYNIMAKEKTEKSCYESHYGGGWITAGQRLAELACERKAESQDETLIPLFWQQGVWNTLFRQQINHANKLLKEYDIAAIMAALRRPDAKRVYSLGAPFFKPMVQQEQQKLELQRKRIENAPTPQAANIKELPRPVTRIGRSLKDRLNDL
jgi:hypothetical protein